MRDLLMIADINISISYIYKSTDNLHQVRKIDTE